MQPVLSAIGIAALPTGPFFSETSCHRLGERLRVERIPFRDQHDVAVFAGSLIALGPLRSLDQAPGRIRPHKPVGNPRGETARLFVDPPQFELLPDRARESFVGGDQPVQIDAVFIEEQVQAIDRAACGVGRGKQRRVACGRIGDVELRPRYGSRPLRAKPRPVTLLFAFDLADHRLQDARGVRTDHSDPAQCGECVGRRRRSALGTKKRSKLIQRKGIRAENVFVEPQQENLARVVRVLVLEPFERDGFGHQHILRSGRRTRWHHTSSADRDYLGGLRGVRCRRDAHARPVEPYMLRILRDEALGIQPRQDGIPRASASFMLLRIGRSRSGHHEREGF